MSLDEWRHELTPLTRRERWRAWRQARAGRMQTAVTYLVIYLALWLSGAMFGYALCLATLR